MNVKTNCSTWARYSMVRRLLRVDLPEQSMTVFSMYREKSIGACCMPFDTSPGEVSYANLSKIATYVADMRITTNSRFQMILVAVFFSVQYHLSVCEISFFNVEEEVEHIFTSTYFQLF